MKKQYKSLVDIKKYERKGIYHSELFLFWKLAKELNVNQIVESGTYYGFTANRLEKLFPDCDIVTYELVPKRWEIAKKKCNKRISVINGRLDQSILTSSTAVIIDGPKWMAAIELAEQIVDKVAFVAIHDMYKYVKELKQRFKYVVHSGHPDSNVKALDKYIPTETIRRNNRKGYHGTVFACVRNK